MIIDLDTNKDQIFNKILFPKLQKARRRFVVSYGGAGSGKSYTQTQYEIVRALQGVEKTLVIRKYGTTIKNSVFSLFKSILTNWGLIDYVRMHSSPPDIIFPNGSEIIFSGLDDPEKIKSIAGISRIWIEEATELTREDLNQLNLRLRGRDKLQMTLTFNPVDETHWIKKHFFDTASVNRHTSIYKTTYLDNSFIDDEYKKVLESYAEIDPNYYRIYALGEWGRLTEGKIYSEWKIIDKFPDLDRWFGLDFGYSNDPTAIVQVANEKNKIYAKEICYSPGMVNKTIADFLKENGYKGELVICDSAEPKSIDELKSENINAIPAWKGQGSVNSGINYLKGRDIYITVDSPNLIAENRFYQWKKDKSGEIIKPPKPKHFMNHLMDALRYAFSLDVQNLDRNSPYAIIT